jgi:hypothetical protein
MSLPPSLTIPTFRYSFPSGVDGMDDSSTRDRSSVSGLFRSPLPDGSIVVPVGSTSSRAPTVHPLDASISTMTSSAASTTFDLEKGNVNEIDGLDKHYGKESKTRKIRLTPGYNPPEKTLYDYAPVFKLFSRTSRCSLFPSYFLSRPILSLRPHHRIFLSLHQLHPLYPPFVPR